MRWYSIRIALFAIAALGIGTEWVDAAENARIPYALLLKIQLTQKKIAAAHSNLLISVRLVPQSSNVSSSSLAAHIEVKTNQIPIKLGPNGEINVPLRHDWLNDDAWLVVNQPKGTMLLDWSIEVVGNFSTNRIRYAEFMKSLIEIDPIQAEMGKAFPNSPRLAIQGLNLYFLKSEDCKVVIRSKNGDQTLKPDPLGLVFVPLNKALLEENPEVWMPILPLKVGAAFKKTGN